MAWLGVGNVGGIVLRADLGNRPSRITLVPSAGFIGAEQARPTTRSVPLALGDTVILFSDGIKDGFAESLVLSNTPQEIADFVITRHVKGNDEDRKSTRLNSSHLVISYAVFCLKKKKNETERNHAIRKVLVMSIYEFSSTAALKNTF